MPTFTIPPASPDPDLGPGGVTGSVVPAHTAPGRAGSAAPADPATAPGATPDRTARVLPFALVALPTLSILATVLFAVTGTSPSPTAVMAVIGCAVVVLLAVIAAGVRQLAADRHTP
ncbi:hypothetical protein CXF45_04745 [Corynebacterium bovis]|nr:hypothetical protein [Corynebacterium bovis]RRO80811.1 hypothetical protein CXF38_05585 [Corynebacterium bovis]RRO81282.1 hypothetical protein CXF36_07310 [Corynebacterium bovis]RRO84267.1 hypothetical protein CXF37_03660 [Corynebacterium bovis]RRO90995.1 hypothetical protein CXF45_04745 [Corynebacterium bovis]